MTSLRAVANRWRAWLSNHSHVFIFRIRAQPTAKSFSEAVVGIQQVNRNGRGALEIAVNDLRKKGAPRVAARTYFRPGELSAIYYGAGFSPQIYPGQRVTAQLYLPVDAPAGLLAALYVWDDNQRVAHQAPGLALTPGAWQSLGFDIPPLHNAPLSQVGIVMSNVGEA